MCSMTFKSLTHFKDTKEESEHREGHTAFLRRFVKGYLCYYTHPHLKPWEEEGDALPQFSLNNYCLP